MGRQLRCRAARTAKRARGAVASRVAATGQTTSGKFVEGKLDKMIDHVTNLNLVFAHNFVEKLFYPTCAPCGGMCCFDGRCLSQIFSKFVSIEMSARASRLSTYGYKCCRAKRG